MNYQALGRRIRQHRVSRGWTQEALAERAGTSVSFLGHIERGSRKASLETIVNIINALGTDANNLLFDSLNTAHQELPINLSSQQRLVLKEVIRALNDSVDTWSD